MRQTPVDNPVGPQEPIYGQYANRATPSYGRWRAARWQDWINLLLGLWIFISPWIFRMTFAPKATIWDGWVTGAVIALAASWAIMQPRALWAELITLIAGAWLFISPWVLGITTGSHSNTGAAWDYWIVGAVVFVLSAWSWLSVRRRSLGSTGYAPRDQVPLPQ